MNPRDAQCVALGGLGLATVVRDLKGNELPHAPEFTAYGRFNYELPLGANGKMNFGLVGSYSAEFSYTPDNLYKEPSKFLANANVGWSSSDDKYALVPKVRMTREELYEFK